MVCVRRCQRRRTIDGRANRRPSPTRRACTRSPAHRMALSPFGKFPRPIGFQRPPASGARSLNLLNGQTPSGIDFGNTIAKAVTIQGTVWSDLDGNGVRATNPITGAFTEPGVAGWQVYVDVNGDGLPTAGEPSAVTDAAGLYTITGASRGTFTIREVPRADWIPTAPATGSSFSDFCTTDKR